MVEEKDPEDSSISHIGTFGTLVPWSHISRLEGKWFIAFSAEKRFFFDISICILAFLQSVIWINSLILKILESIVRVSKAWKFVISKHEIFLATIFD